MSMDFDTRKSISIIILEYVELPSFEMAGKQTSSITLGCPQIDLQIKIDIRDFDKIEHTPWNTLFMS